MGHPKSMYNTLRGHPFEQFNFFYFSTPTTEIAIPHCDLNDERGLKK